MNQRNGIASLPSGRFRYVKMDNDTRNQLSDIIGEYPTMSTNEMNKILQCGLQNKPRLSDSCI